MISYAHADEVYKNELESHLAPLLISNLISSWSDRKLQAGAFLYKEIRQQMESADVVFLLISSSYLSSTSCLEEMQSAFGRHESGLSMVVPVITRPCDWTILPLGDILATPKDGVPISIANNRDVAWLDVVRSLRELLQSWQPLREQAVDEPPSQPLPEVTSDGTSQARWVNKKYENDILWADFKDLFAQTIEEKLSPVIPEEQQFQVRWWGENILVNITHNSYSATKRLILDDATGYDGYSGYQLEIYPSKHQGLSVQPQTYRWIELQSGTRTLAKIDGKSILTLDDIATDLASQIVETQWGKKANGTAKKSKAAD